MSYSNIFVAVKFLYYDEPIPLFSVLNVDDSNKSFSTVDESVGRIIIDKIDLDRKFYPFDSNLNDVNKNVAIISP